MGRILASLCSVGSMQCSSLHRNVVASEPQPFTGPLPGELPVGIRRFQLRIGLDILAELSHGINQCYQIKYSINQNIDIHNLRRVIVLILFDFLHYFIVMCYLNKTYIIDLKFFTDLSI